MPRDRCAPAALAAMLAVCAAAAARQDAPAASSPPARVTVEAVEPGAPDLDTGTVRPEAARRVVRLFDFEEKGANPYAWPRHWLRAQDGLKARTENGKEIEFKRPGFPSWNLAELDYTSPAFTGVGSVRLPISGGSTALRLEPGVIPVFADADYLVTAHVRTDGLSQARAFLEARFLDAQLVPIEGSRTASAPIVSEGAWTPVEVEMRGAFDRAAYLELELSVLQPEQQGGIVPGYRPPPQDYSGSAWFDDLTVSQLPRIELTAGAPGGIFVSPGAPELHLNIRDLTGESLTARVTVTDSAGRTVDSLARDIGAGRARLPWTPAIARFGWYRAALGVFSKDTLVGRAHADFLWLDADPLGMAPSRRLTEDRRRFGLIIDPAPPELGDVVEEVARRVGTGSVTLPGWVAGITAPTAKDYSRTLGGIVEPLLDRGQAVSLTLPRMPEDLAALTRLDPDDPWRVLAGDRKLWGPFLEPILERFGQRVRHWQIGDVGDQHAPGSRTLADDMRAVDRSLSSLVPSPVITVPWPIDRPPRPEVAAAGVGRARLSVLVPADAAPGSIARFADEWRAGPAGTELEFVLDQGPIDPAAPGKDLAGLARRAVEVWASDRAASGADPGATDRSLIAASLRSPWSLGDRPNLQVGPRPELAVWSTLARRLSDRRVVGQFQAGEGARCYILAPAPGTPEDRAGALVAWKDSASTEPALLRAYVGQGPVTVVDLFGNSAPAPKDDALGDRPAEPAKDADVSAARPTARRSGVRVPLSTEPVFIEGVDARLIKFLSSVRIEPAMLVPTNTNHEHAIVFDNPWSVPLEVKSFVASPGGYDTPDGTRDRRWKVTPRAGRATVPPGAQGRIPLTVAFAASEEAGLKEFVLDLEITSDRDYGVIRTSANVELGLPEIALELAAIREGKDLVVEARVTNRGTHAMDLELTATAPDQPRAKAPISQLPPGRQSVRRFPYARSLEAMRGKRVSVAVLEPETGARIVRSVVVE